MSYSVVGIANLALSKIGAKIIASVDENTPNAIKVKTVWDYVLDEVLQAKDWRFSKTRVELATITTEPVFAYSYAYQLPADFLRLIKPNRTYIPSTNPADYYYGLITQGDDSESYSAFLSYDAPVWPPGYSYIIEEVVVSAKSQLLCLLTDYYDSTLPLKINYIRRETNPAKYFPLFVNALATRLAAELAIPVTEDIRKNQLMMQLYKTALRDAEIYNQSMDFLATDETGSTSWETAGRC